MDIKKLDALRKEVLIEMENEFTDELIPAKYSEKDGAEIEELVVMMDGIDAGLDDMTSEFFFLPSEEEDEVQFFISLITVETELNQENIGELLKAVATINTYFVAATFAIDAVAGSLVYKLSYPMAISRANKEDMLLDVELSTGTAMQMVESFAYLLCEVNAGTRDSDSVIEILT